MAGLDALRPTPPDAAEAVAALLASEDSAAMDPLARQLLQGATFRFVYDLERLSSQTHPVSTLWDPTDPKGE